MTQIETQMPEEQTTRKHYVLASASKEKKPEAIILDSEFQRIANMAIVEWLRENPHAWIYTDCLLSYGKDMDELEEFNPDVVYEVAVYENFELLDDCVQIILEMWNGKTLAFGTVYYCENVEFVLEHINGAPSIEGCPGINILPLFAFI